MKWVMKYRNDSSVGSGLGAHAFTFIRCDMDTDSRGCFGGNPVDQTARASFEEPQLHCAAYQHVERAQFYVIDVPKGSTVHEGLNVFNGLNQLPGLDIVEECFGEAGDKQGRVHETKGTSRLRCREQCPRFKIAFR